MKKVHVRIVAVGHVEIVAVSKALFCCMRDGHDSNTQFLLGSAVGMKFLEIFAHEMARILAATAYMYMLES